MIHSVYRLCLTRRHQLPGHDIQLFLKTLVDLLAAGIDLPWALTTTGQILSHKKLQHSCAEQVQALLEGKTWPDVLADSEIPAWPSGLIAWVKVAIKTGAMIESLTCYAEQLDESDQFKKALGRQLAYPVSVLFLALGLSWFTGNQFQAQGKELVLLTLAVVTCVLVIAIYTIWFIQRPGGIREQQCWGQCSRALALCINAGLSWPIALATLVEDLPEIWRGQAQIGNALSDSLEGITRGLGICMAGSQANFPDMLQRSLQLANMTGDLGRSLMQASQLLKISQQESLRRLLSVLPATALALAAITLGVQYALFIHPLYQQMGTL